MRMPGLPSGEPNKSVCIYSVTVTVNEGDADLASSSSSSSSNNGYDWSTSSGGEGISSSSSNSSSSSDVPPEDKEICCKCSSCKDVEGNEYTIATEKLPGDPDKEICMPLSEFKKKGGSATPDPVPTAFSLRSVRAVSDAGENFHRSLGSGVQCGKPSRDFHEGGRKHGGCRHLHL